MLSSGPSSTNLAQDFGRTLDGLSGVLKLHRGGRAPLPHGTLASRLLRVESDPTFTRLPEISNSRRLTRELTRDKKEQEPPHQHQKSRRLPARRPPRLERHPRLPTESASLPPASSSRRLLAGPSTQVGFRNKRSASVLPPINVSEGPMRGTKRNLEETHQSGFSQTGMRKSVTMEFHDNLQALKASIDDVQSSLDGYHGRAAMQQLAGTVNAGTHGSIAIASGETVASNAALRAGLPSPVEAEEEVDEGEALRIRMMQYRYVRKIETPPEPLSGGEAISDTEEDSRPGSAIARHKSPTYLKRFTPEGRTRLRAEMVDARNRNMDAARDRRLRDEQSKESQALHKVAMYEERMAKLAQGDKSIEALRAAAPLRLQQKRHWQATLALIGFFQICAEVLFRFKTLREEYMAFLEKEDFFSADRMSTQDLAAVAGLQLLRRNLGEVARMKMKQEWRLPKQLKSVWCIKFEDEQSAPDKESDGIDSPESTVLVPQQDEVVALRVEAPQSKVIVCMPYPEETSRLLKNSAYLQAALMRRIRIIRARKQASIIAKSLGLWQKAKPFVFMLEYARKTRQIQKFVRWSIRRLAEVRTRVESDWMRLEREVFVTELRARGGTALQGGDPGTRRHANLHVTANHSLLAAKKTRRGAIALDQDVPLVHMVREERRQFTIRQELRRRRVKLLPQYEVWLTDMDLYWREVEEWRSHRQACKLQNVRSEMRMPLMPPCPSHIPSDEELTQVIQLTWDEENNIKRPSEVVPETGANAMTAALLRTATSTHMLWPKRPEAIKAAEDKEDFSDDAVAEVRQLLALPVFAPIGADSAL